MARKKTSKRRYSDVEDVPLTPMIDVVFQLLVYFVFTFQPIDVLTNLQVYRPQPDPSSQRNEPPPQVVTITIFDGGFTINDSPIGAERLRSMALNILSKDPKQMIMIRCSASSRHNDLIRVLDMCAEAGLNNLSVISTN